MTEVLTRVAILFILLIVIRFDISRFRKEKSRAYLDDRERKRKAFLAVSLAARDAGAATEQQLQFLARYERVVVEEEKRLQARSIFGRAIDGIFPGAPGQATRVGRLNSDGLGPGEGVGGQAGEDTRGGGFGAEEARGGGGREKQIKGLVRLGGIKIALRVTVDLCTSSSLIACILEVSCI